MLLNEHEYFMNLSEIEKELETIELLGGDINTLILTEEEDAQLAKRLVDELLIILMRRHRQ